jgi:hypothetical protein
MRFVLVAALAGLVSGASLLPRTSLAQGSAPPLPAAVTHVQTAADLAAVCDPSGTGVPKLEAIAYCQGFLTGFGQYHTLLHPAGGRSRPLYCVPPQGMTIAQSGLGFAAWSRQNPSFSSEPALDGLLRWAQATLPCPPAAKTAKTSKPAR